MRGQQVHVVRGADEVDRATREELLRCWVDVTDAGGATGFPFPPRPG